MKMSDLLSDFQIKFPLLVEAMDKSTHHWDSQTLNIHHLEGSVWGHALMVCLMAESRKVKDVIKVAALLHDIGKPLSITKAEDKKRIRMFGHEGISVYLGIDFVNSLDISDEQKIYILKLVSHHSAIYKAMRTSSFEEYIIEKFSGDKDFLEDLISLTACDALGRFSFDEDRSLWENADAELQYLVHKTNPIIHPRKTKGEALILVGPPCSGKSSWIKANAQGYTVVCRDQVIMDLGKGKSYSDAYVSVDQSEVDSIYDKTRKEALKSNNNLVFDLTHMSPKSRRRSLSGLPRDLKRVAVVFLAGYSELLARNEKRGKEEGKLIPLRAMHQLLGAFEFPLVSEGFDEVRVVFSK